MSGFCPSSVILESEEILSPWLLTALKISALSSFMRQEDAYEGPTMCGGRILQENPSGLRFRNLEFTASLNYLIDIQEVILLL